MSKASVSGEVRGKSSRKISRGHRGRHVAKDHERKLRTSYGSPRHGETCTAKASRINRRAAKSRCARNWGGWGQLSVEGLGQNNPDRSEDPWGRATTVARMAALKRTTAPTPSGGKQVWKRGARRREANQLGATIGRLTGKAPSDRPALKPYGGKPAVRNFRGGDGNVGIIRSPVRAIALPDNRYEVEDARACAAMLADFPYPTTKRATDSPEARGKGSRDLAHGLRAENHTFTPNTV